MIGIIVPAHNEEQHIGSCLRSLLAAANHLALANEPVEIIVVLDDCSDDTAIIARGLGAKTIEIHARKVGIARQVGAQIAIIAGVRWLAFTDADSVVAPNWLAAQLALNVDVVCGTITVKDWGMYGKRMQRHFELTYHDIDGHSHIHGANLGVSTHAYIAAGGFLALATGEDVALVEALKKNGARIAWSSKPRVITSARPNFKAPAGFGATLARIEKLHQWVVNNKGAA